MNQGELVLGHLRCNVFLFYLFVLKDEKSTVQFQKIRHTKIKLR